jgi:Ca2+-binding EF-hand superfamily protein
MKRLLLSCALCGLVSTSAWAQPPQDEFGSPLEGPGGANEIQGPGPAGPPPNVIFEAIDADGDGVITSREMRKAVAALKRLDADGDGNLTLAEVVPQGAPMGQPGNYRMGGSGAGMGGPDPGQVGQMLMQADANNDGLITPDEVPPQARQMLQFADADGNGVIDPRERKAAMMRAGDRSGRGRGNYGPRGPQGAPGSNSIQQP